MDGVDVIAAVLVVIDEHLPVALQLVIAPAGEAAVCRRPALAACSGNGARNSASVCVPAAPDGPRRSGPSVSTAIGGKPVSSRRKSSTPSNSGVPRSFAGQVVGPAVIAAAQFRDVAARLVEDRGGPVPADVVKCPQRPLRRRARPGSVRPRARPSRMSPGPSPCSARPTYCQVAPKTLRHSRSYRA